MHMCANIHKQFYIHACMHTSMHAYIHTYIHTYRPANIDTHMHRCMCSAHVHLYVHAKMYMHAMHPDITCYCGRNTAKLSTDDDSRL